MLATKSDSLFYIIMAPEDSKTILLDRRSSSLSTLSRASSLSNDTPALGPAHKTKADENQGDGQRPLTGGGAASAVSWTSKQNLLIGFLVFLVGVFQTGLFLPSHEHVYTREHPFQKTRHGEVLLNAELNYPLVYPASVPCE